jgi:hypothetical protein
MQDAVPGTVAERPIEAAKSLQWKSLARDRRRGMALAKETPEHRNMVSLFPHH